MILALLAAAALEPPRPTYPEPPVPRPDLSWLAGYWLACEHGVEMAETWSAWRAPYMHGFSVIDAVGAGRATIGPSGGGYAGGISLYWQPGGQEEKEYVLVRAGPREAVFENAAVAYPRRIIYRRSGRRLSWRIEGTRPDGGPETAEFTYRAARFNRQCPPSREPRDPELVAD